MASPTGSACVPTSIPPGTWSYGGSTTWPTDRACGQVPYSIALSPPCFPTSFPDAARRCRYDLESLAPQQARHTLPPGSRPLCPIGFTSSADCPSGSRFDGAVGLQPGHRVLLRSGRGWGCRSGEQAESCRLGIGEQAGPDEEAHALRRLDREAAAPPGHHIDGQVRVLPVFVLAHRHPERDRAIEADVEIGQADIGVAGDELAVGETHRRRLVAD